MDAINEAIEVLGAIGDFMSNPAEWFMSLITQFVAKLSLRGFLVVIFDLFSNIGDAMTVLPDGAFEQLYENIMIVTNQIFVPFGAALLGSFMLFELSDINSRSDRLNNGSGINSIMVPMQTLVKFGLCSVYYFTVPHLMRGFVEISNWLQTSVLNALGSGTSVNIVVDNLKINMDGYMPADFLVTLLLCIVIFLIVSLAYVVVGVLMLGRTIELLILISVSPIPFATISSSTQQGIAVNFIRTTLSVGLQGVLIVFVIWLWKTIVATFFVAEGFDTLNGMLMSIAIYSLTLLISLSSTGKWAKSILNAM